MSAERFYRRAKNLGLKIDSKNVGGHYRKRMLNYNLTTEYEEGITLKRVRAKYNDVCQICGLLVDDTAIENGHIKRLYPTIDHIIPLSKGGSHTWDNVRLAHMSCNAGKCDRND
jgi:5-methylcytosine-specific restriction endonuclease McrA